ncbi:Uncharacterised protein [Macrococcoides caseolyticum]|nr:Uncharacterised protein [Macrococcus caseolyticus]
MNIMIAWITFYKVSTSIYAILKGVKNYHGFSSLEETIYTY